MEEKGEKKANVGLIIGLILGIPIIGFAIIALIAIPLMNNMVGEARERACCIDAGGRWERGANDCVDLKDEEMYNSCLEGRN